MNITTTYPPKVQEYRDSLLAVLEDLRVQAERKLAERRTPNVMAVDVREVQRVQRWYIEAARPINAELARCEMFAGFSCIVEPDTLISCTP